MTIGAVGVAAAVKRLFATRKKKLEIQATNGESYSEWLTSHISASMPSETRRTHHFPTDGH